MPCLCFVMIPDAETVFEYWREVRNRLITDRDAAFLDDLVAIAKATR